MERESEKGVGGSWKLLYRGIHFLNQLRREASRQQCKHFHFHKTQNRKLERILLEDFKVVKFYANWKESYLKEPSDCRALVGVIDTRTCQLFRKAAILESKFLEGTNFPKYIGEEPLLLSQIMLQVLLNNCRGEWRLKRDVFTSDNPSKAFEHNWWLQHRSWSHRDEAMFTSGFCTCLVIHPKCIACLL